MVAAAVHAVQPASVPYHAIPHQRFYCRLNNQGRPVFPAQNPAPRTKTGA